jgi:hypothetical protein
MTRSRLLKEGGPHRIRKTGPDQYNMNVSIPTDQDGMTARECKADECSPAFFKVKSGTGITEDQETAYCPYCRHEDSPDEFFTEEQLRYAKDVAVREVHEGVDQMLREALGLGASGKKKMGGGLLSIEMSLKPGSKPVVRRPFEEEVRRDVVCPHCGLNHSVYGLAIWCPDCGEDIFLTHVEAELSVIHVMLGDVDRRRNQLGVRVAAKDLENCLEDTVSIFEAVLKALVKRYMLDKGETGGEIDRFFKKIGSAFQNVHKTENILTSQLGLSLFENVPDDEIEKLSQTYEKRHPITHNLGVVDKKYIERARSAEQEGKEVLVSASEIQQALELSMVTFQSLHRRMFGAQKD